MRAITVYAYLQGQFKRKEGRNPGRGILMLVLHRCKQHLDFARKHMVKGHPEQTS